MWYCGTMSTDTAPTKHFAILLGSSEQTQPIVQNLLYRDLIVIGACPSPNETSAPGQVEHYLANLAAGMVVNKGVSDVHLLQFPENQVRCPQIVEILRKSDAAVTIASVSVETEGGCRAYFEDALDLIPEPGTPTPTSTLNVRTEKPKEVDGPYLGEVPMPTPDDDGVGPEDLRPSQEAADRVLKRVDSVSQPTPFGDVDIEGLVQDLSAAHEEVTRLRAQVADEGARVNHLLNILSNLTEIPHR